MSQTELQRVANQLEISGYSHTSYEALGLALDQKQVDTLNTEVARSEGSQPALDVIEHIDKRGMSVVQAERCLTIARTLMAPAVELLFADAHDADPDEQWSIFGINRYLAGGNFGAHVDKVGKSVAVFTFKGDRIFEICEKFEDESAADGFRFGKVTDSFQASLGSIIILDRDADPGHSVANVISDSTVAVADVPGIIRNRIRELA